MAVNRGKDFESEIKASFDLPDVSIDRFPDPMAGYAGIRNICDFGVYRYPFQHYFECKAISGNTLNFSGAITDNQWAGLIEKAKIPGVVAGYLVWFKDHDLTVFVSALELKHLKDQGAKSLNIKDIKGNGLHYIEVPAQKKRIMFTYDGKEFLKRVKKWATDYWVEVMTNGFKDI